MMPLNSVNLSRQVATGLFTTSLGKGAVAFVQLVSLVILARLIDPHDFGVMGAAAIVVGLSEIITELGLGAAIVQRESLEERHLATAFSSSLVLGVGIGVMIFLLAPMIAIFFDSSELGDVLKVLALLFPIRSLATVGESIAQRRLRFGFLAAAEIVSVGLGYFLFGVGLGSLGYGVWALVGASLGASGLKTMMFLWAYPPRSFLPNGRAFVELLYFGGGHTVARISNYLALQGDNLVVGRTLGLYSLGIYGRAYQMMSSPASVFGQILDRVMFPSMARIQGQTERLSVAYMRGVSLIALLMLPASVVGVVLAPELVITVLGDAWSEAVLPFRVLLIGLLMRTSYKLSDSLARATGAVYRRAWRQAVYAVLVMGGAWVGHFWGVAGVATGVLAAVTVNFLLMAQISLKLVGRSWRDFIAAHKHAAVLAAAVTIMIYPTVYMAREMNFAPYLLLLGVVGVLMLFAVAVVRFAPVLVLGSEGVWLLEMLCEYLPPRFRLVISRPIGQATRSYGVSDASVENA